MTSFSLRGLELNKLFVNKSLVILTGLVLVVNAIALSPNPLKADPGGECCVHGRFVNPDDPEPANSGDPSADSDCRCYWTIFDSWCANKSGGICKGSEWQVWEKGECVEADSGSCTETNVVKTFKKVRFTCVSEDGDCEDSGGCWCSTKLLVTTMQGVVDDCGGLDCGDDSGGDGH